jgi:hypothetical protein
MRWTRQRRHDRQLQGRLRLVSDAPRADERRFNASAKIRLAAHGWSKGLVEVAAYGEVVWSWHPLLMSSRRRRVGPTGLRQPFNPPTTVTKRNSSPGSTKETVKTIAQEAPGVPGYLW